ncbi:MAG: hypothetical protein IAF38_19765 [Bacteroidia bacterium]|nr:hypothetical protein [Bacteroidia bacterium]
MKKIKKLIKVFVLISIISSCTTVKETARYYNQNKALTLALYENYLKINKQFPFGGIKIAGKERVEIAYMTTPSQRHTAYFDNLGNFKEATDSFYPDVLKSDLVKTFIKDFVKSKYIAICDGSNRDYVFFAYRDARYNNREYLGIMIGDNGEKYEPIRKIEDKVYVRERDVP